MSREIYVYVEKNYRADPEDKMIMGRIGVGLREVASDDGANGLFTRLHQEATELVDKELRAAQACFQTKEERLVAAIEHEKEVL